MKKVNILGTSYAVYIGVSYQKDNELKGRFGYCSHMERKLSLAIYPLAILGKMKVGRYDWHKSD